MKTTINNWKKWLLYKYLQKLFLFINLSLRRFLVLVARRPFKKNMIFSEAIYWYSRFLWNQIFLGNQGERLVTVGVLYFPLGWIRQTTRRLMVYFNSRSIKILHSPMKKYQWFSMMNDESLLHAVVRQGMIIAEILIIPCGLQRFQQFTRKEISIIDEGCQPI